MSGPERAIAQLYAAADAARAANRLHEAALQFERILALDADQPRALNALGLRMLESGYPGRAVELLGRAVRVDPTAIELRLNLADAQAPAGDDAGELASLDAVLAIEPYQVVALLRKAQNQEHAGHQATAACGYGAILSIVGMATLPPALEAAVAHGRKVIAAEQQALGETLAPFLMDAARQASARCRTGSIIASTR